jgi:hypothetical protein
MDSATLLLGTIFVVLTVAMTIAGGYAYYVHRKLEARRKRKR